MRTSIPNQLADSLTSVAQLRRRFARMTILGSMNQIVAAVRAMRESQREKSSDRKSREAAVDALLDWYREQYEQLD